jgi:hypothetical protein
MTSMRRCVCSQRFCRANLPADAKADVDVRADLASKPVDACSAAQPKYVWHAKSRRLEVRYGRAAPVDLFHRHTSRRGREGEW